MGKAAWIIPILVAISAVGGLSVHVMTSSRMLFVGARNGHFPALLAHINVKHYSPMPSLFFLVSLHQIKKTRLLIFFFSELPFSVNALH